MTWGAGARHFHTSGLHWEGGWWGFLRGGGRIRGACWGGGGGRGVLWTADAVQGGGGGWLIEGTWCGWGGRGVEVWVWGSAGQEESCSAGGRWHGSPFPNPPTPSLSRRGGGSGRGVPYLPCRGGGSRGSTARNDPRVAFVGGGGGFGRKKRLPNLCSGAFGANIRSYTKQRARHRSPFLRTPPPPRPAAGIRATAPAPRSPCGPLMMCDGVGGVGGGGALRHWSGCALFGGAWVCLQLLRPGGGAGRRSQKRPPQKETHGAARGPGPPPAPFAERLCVNDDDRTTRGHRAGRRTAGPATCNGPSPYLWGGGGVMAVRGGAWGPHTGMGEGEGFADDEGGAACSNIDTQPCAKNFGGLGGGGRDSNRPPPLRTIQSTKRVRRSVPQGEYGASGRDALKAMFRLHSSKR